MSQQKIKKKYKNNSINKQNQTSYVSSTPIVKSETPVVTDIEPSTTVGGLRGDLISQIHQLNTYINFDFEHNNREDDYVNSRKLRELYERLWKL